MLSKQLRVEGSQLEEARTSSACVSARAREDLKLQNLQRATRIEKLVAGWGFISTPYCVMVPAQSNKQKLDFNSFPTTSAAPL